MGKINLSNIQASLNRAKEAAAPLQNKGHTENVPVDFIRPADRNIYNENDSEENIRELADNIEACGLLHPITVNKISSDDYQIISGERRYRAITTYLHWKSIPCMVFEGLSEDSAQLKLFMANLTVREYTSGQRFHYYREVKELLERMIKSGEYSGSLQKGIAKVLNVTDRQVCKYSQLEKLPENIQQDVIDGKISLNKAIEMFSDKNDNSSDNFLVEKLLSGLTAEQKSLLLSGEIDLSVILSQKAEPVPLSENISSAIYSDSMEKAEPVPLSENTSSTIYSDSMEKTEPVPLPENTSSTIYSDSTEKAEPVPLSKNTSSAIYSESMEKAEPVPLSENTSSAIYSDSMEKAEPVPPSENTSLAIYSDSMEKAEPVPLSTISKSKRLQDDSVIFYKNDCYAPNKIQILEEHEQYTVFKVFAVKRYKDS